MDLQWHCHAALRWVPETTGVAIMSAVTFGKAVRGMTTGMQPRRSPPTGREHPESSGREPRSPTPIRLKAL
jgi:hypothetical protein